MYSVQESHRRFENTGKTETTENRSKNPELVIDLRSNADSDGER